MWKPLPNLERQMDWIFHRSTIVLFIKWKRWNFQRWTECLGTSIFFCVLGLFSTSLLPSLKLFQWNDFTGINNRICHSLEKETSLWRKSSEDAGGLTTWENIFPFMPYCFWGVNDLHLEIVIFKHIYSYSRWNFIYSVCYTASKGDTM